MLKSLVLSLFILNGSQAFAPTSTSTNTAIRNKNLQLHSIEPAGGSPIDAFVDDIKMRVRIAQESNASGADAKQTIADVLAGAYDAAEVGAKIDEAIASAPCGKLVSICLYEYS